MSNFQYQLLMAKQFCALAALNLAIAQILAFSWRGEQLVDVIRQTLG